MVVERHRAELLRLERAAGSEMTRAYGGIAKRLRHSLNQLLREYSEALAAGEDMSPAWLFRRARLESLQGQVEAELRRFAGQAETRIVANEQRAVDAAGAHFSEVMRAAGRGVEGRWDRLPQEAVEDLVGFTRDGSPLRTLLDGLGAQASRAVRDDLIQGLALGENPRKIARRVRASLGGNLTRALRISRTETLRAYREATRRNYQANSDVVTGWRWLCAKQPRTCAACLAMDGTMHTLKEHLDDHPNGRCAMVPVLRGEESKAPSWETGTDWFTRQGEDVQRQVLGGAGYEAYQKGAVTLVDFVGQRYDAAWGSTRSARSLRAILGDEAAARFYAGATE